MTSADRSAVFIAREPARRQKDVDPVAPFIKDMSSEVKIPGGSKK
jgi:hypothetical protein